MKNPKLISGIILLVLLVGVAVFGPVLAQRALFADENPLGRGEFRPFQLPSPEHPLGTDGDGRDGLMVFLSSMLPSFVIGFIAGLVATSLGVLIGFTAGYSTGRLDTLFRIGIDMVLVIPTLPLLLILAVYIDRWNLGRLALILGIFSWPFSARVIRAQVQSLRERRYIDLARLSGANTAEIIFLEILPALLPYIAFFLSAGMVGAMLAEAGLLFIGLGGSGLPTLGFMIAKGLREGVIGVGLLGQMFLPAATLILTFLALNLIGLGLDEIFNPRLRTTVEER
mgnify:FL=1